MNFRQMFSCNQKQTVIKSKLKFIKPPKGSNVAREIIESLNGRNSGKTLLIDAQSGSGHQYTGHELWQLTARLATGLMKSALKLELGERVLLMCDHNLPEKLTMLAALYAGATIQGILPEGYDYVELASEPSQPQVLVVSSEQLDLAKRARRQIQGMSKARIVLIGGQSALMVDNSQENDNIFHYEELLEWPELDEKLIMVRVQSIKPKSHHCNLALTSGSTGRSKVVPWTHYARLAEIYKFISATRASIGQQQQPLLPIGRADFVVAGDSPLDQGAALTITLMSLLLGAKYVLMKRCDELQFWRDVSKYKITCSIGSSTFAYKCLKRLIHWPPGGEAIDISSLKIMAGSGAPVNLAPLVELLRPLHPQLEVINYYGATELNDICMLSCEDVRRDLKLLKSVGYLLPGVKVKVVDIATGKSVGPGEEGELLVKSPTLFHSYIPHPDETVEELMRDRKDEQGFYRTGDLVHYDHEQRFYIHSRIKDTLYLDDDWKIPPSEIEAHICQHPIVESAVVVGVPSAEIDGCVIPKAFIKLRTQDELKHWFASSSLDQNRELFDMNYILKLLKSPSSENNQKLIIEDIHRILKELRVCELLHPSGGIVILDEFPKIIGRQKIDRRKLMLMNQTQ